ncbi:MAG: nicotinamide-nucleotide amidohydrolase family protein [Candidatus Omnitrophica bacterium]|nr:nicotinamide-nucleotide amidohydrolase family protein [Candidatus Omnitrophota bacterium]
MRIEQKVFKKFTQRAQTLAIAESCTGGLIGDRLTNIAGASAFFLLGIIAYDNAAKTKLLGVPSSLFETHGAVSKPVASAMAQGVRKLLKTDYGLSVTGIAGPGGGSKTKPVGLVFIAVSTKQKTSVKEFLFKGTRLAVKNQACQTALKMLAK